MNNEFDREAFEKWAELNIGWRDANLQRCNDDPDCYILDITQHAWLAWRAAREQDDGEAVAKIYRDDYGKPQAEFLDPDMYIEDGMKLYAHTDLTRYAQRLRQQAGEEESNERA